MQVQHRKRRKKNRSESSSDRVGAEAHPFAVLTPEILLDALDSTGIRPDGRLIALNSYENRVYQFYSDDPAGSTPFVVKFYRPGRWSDAAIQEEHDFCRELSERELPVVAPLTLHGASLHHHHDLRFAIYPRHAGRPPEFDYARNLAWMGRFLGRIHAVGALRRFAARPALDVQSFGEEPLDFLRQGHFLPPDLAAVYLGVAEQALACVRQCYVRAGPVRSLRLHGDCHAGNVLWSDGDDGGPCFVDFDDARQGPAIQDLWMLLSGPRDEQERQLHEVLDGYSAFHAFDPAELHLLEALRTLRLINYAGWLARRWDDPAFPVAFPWFGTARYWQDRILELREQIALMDEPPLVYR